LIDGDRRLDFESRRADPFGDRAAFFVVLLIFRKEIKSVLSRIASISVKRGGTQVEAALNAGDDPMLSDTSLASDSADAKGGRSESSAEAALAAAEADADPDVEKVRGEMMKAYIAGDKSVGDARYAELVSLEADANESRKDQARKYATQLIGGIDTNGLETLRSMIHDDENASFIYRMIGLALKATGLDPVLALTPTWAE
jgi:hypothetical protein